MEELPKGLTAKEYWGIYDKARIVWLEEIKKCREILEKLGKDVKELKEYLGG